MPAEFPKQLIRKVENENFPLLALGAIADIRTYLDDAEGELLTKALELGASADDIAEALSITRQGAYYKIKALEKGGRAKRSPKGSSSSEEDEESDAVTIFLTETATKGG